MHKAIREFEAAQMKTDIPEFRPGDTLRISMRIVEGEKTRIQDYQGICIGRRGSGSRETITVRRVSYGVGMERVFPLHSPRIEKISVVRRGKVRRAKLYFLRKLSGKKARIQEIRPVSKKAAKLARAAVATKTAPPPVVEAPKEAVATTEETVAVKEAPKAE